MLVIFLCAGGVGSAVAEALSEESGVTIKMLAVSRVPSSGPGGKLLQEHGIAADGIVAAVRSVIA